MPSGRRNAKSNSKHHAHTSDSNSNRHSTPPVPTQIKVLPPKHIPLPDFPPASDIVFEFDAFLLSMFAMLGQYINLYKTVFWLPYSHTEYALNWYLIDYYVVAVNLIMMGRRLPVCLLKKLFKICFPSSSLAIRIMCVHIFTIVVLGSLLFYCFYNVIHGQGIMSSLLLLYPFIVYGVVIGPNFKNLLELHSAPPQAKSFGARSKHSAPINKNSSMVTHVCSMSAETIREEVEMLKTDFNNRWKQVLFNSFLVVYHAAFLPCFFSQSTLHYNVNWATQHGVFTGISCITLYTAHCFPPKYCDVLHRAALHLGGWQKVEIKNSHVPSSTWTETSMWNQGALVKHQREFFKAEGISNAAEPGHVGQYKFYTLFKNPSDATKLVWLVQLLLLASEMCVLIKSHTWNDLISVQLLILMNCKTLYTVTKIYFVVKKIYYEESILISKFSN